MPFLVVFVLALVAFFTVLGAAGLLACGLGSLRGSDLPRDRRYLKWGLGGAVPVLALVATLSVRSPHPLLRGGWLDFAASKILPPLCAAGVAMSVLYLWEEYFE